MGRTILCHRVSAIWTWFATHKKASESKKAEEKKRGRSNSQKSALDTYVPDNTHYNHAQRFVSYSENDDRDVQINYDRIRLDRNNGTAVGSEDVKAKTHQNGHANGSVNTPDRVYIIKKYRMKDWTQLKKLLYRIVK